MIAHFFIDRPIFAAVLSIVITLTGLLAVIWLPLAQYPQITPPSVQVSINYPGASAQVVADTVAAPIEEQVNGVENMLYMSSQAGNDGSYTLSVTFAVGTNLNTALVMVQNRVTLAMPQLPTDVQLQGITIRKKTPDILNVVNLISPDGRYDDLYLSNYAYINLHATNRCCAWTASLRTSTSSGGMLDYSIRAWLDPQKLASCSLTAMDVATAIQGQNIEAVGGQVGQPPTGPGQTKELPVNALGRLRDPEQFGDIIIKVGQGARLQTAAANAAPPASTVSSNPTASGTVGAATLNGGLLGSTTSSNGTSNTSGTTSNTTTSSTATLPTGPATTGPTITSTSRIGGATVHHDHFSIGGAASTTITPANSAANMGIGTATGSSSGMIGSIIGTTAGLGGLGTSSTTGGASLAAAAPSTQRHDERRRRAQRHPARACRREHRPAARRGPRRARRAELQQRLHV